MNILEKEWIPLTENEFNILQNRYTQKMDNLTLEKALEIFHSVFPLAGSMFNIDEYFYNLLLRHLHTTINWTDFPERLL